MTLNAKSILFVCPRWSPTRGGTQVCNRALATATARAGHSVACLVEHIEETELQDARSRGVVLLPAEQAPDGPSLRIPAAAALAFDPDVVVGHDRFTGPAAWLYARKYTKARLVHIFHTAPAELERFQNSAGATRRAEEHEEVNRRIAADADVIAAVGPRLTRYAADLLEDGSGNSRVLKLDPGLEIEDLTPRRPPAHPHVLVLGRTNNVVQKGLDLAVQAIAALPGTGVASARLLVRGAPDAECDGLHDELVALSGIARERVDVRPYTIDPDRLRRDLARSALYVLPSRVEGFGLSAFEAIAAGTPVLLSAKSGAAELLRTHLGRGAEPMIMDVTDNPAVDIPRWSSAIGAVLEDLPGAFLYAQEIRVRLASILNWHSTAATLDEAL